MRGFIASRLLFETVHWWISPNREMTHSTAAARPDVNCAQAKSKANSLVNTQAFYCKIHIRRYIHMLRQTHRSLKSCTLVAQDGSRGPSHGTRGSHFSASCNYQTSKSYEVHRRSVIKPLHDHSRPRQHAFAYVPYVHMACGLRRARSVSEDCPGIKIVFWGESLPSDAIIRHEKR